MSQEVIRKAKNGLSSMISFQPGRLAKGSLAMTAGMGLRIVGQALVFILVARAIGVEAYGAYVSVVTLAMTFGSFTGLGTSLIMLQDTARGDAVFQDSWGRTVAAWIITGPLLLLSYCLLAWQALPGQISARVIAPIGIAEIAVSPLLVFVLHAYQGHDRIAHAARLMVVPVLPRLCGAIILLIIGYRITREARLCLWSLMYLSAAITTVAFAFRLLQHELGAGIAFKGKGLARSIRQGWPFSLGGAAQKVYVDMDKVMLAKMSTLEATGSYAGAYRIVDIAEVPLQAFFAAAAPRFFRAGKVGTANASRYALKVLPVPIAYGLTASTALFMLADLVPRLLGSEFGPAVDALRWLAFLPLLTTPRRLMQTVLATSGNQGYSFIILTLGAVLNMLTNLWAIHFWGWRGAVGATYVSELFLISGMFYTCVKSSNYSR